MLDIVSIYNPNIKENVSCKLEKISEKLVSDPVLGSQIVLSVLPLLVAGHCSNISSYTI